MTTRQAVPRPRQPILLRLEKSSGVSSSASVITPVLKPPGMTALTRRPRRTPPASSSIGWIGLHADRAEPSRAAIDDVDHAGHRLDIVDHRRLAEEAFDGREGRF